MTTRELVEQRAKLIADMRALVALADASKREMTAEEDAKWNEMDSDADRLKSTIQKRQKLEAEERALDTSAAPVSAEARAIIETSEVRKAKEMRAWEAWLRYGVEGMTPDQRSIMNTRRSFVSSSELPVEVRALSTSGSAGGYMIPQGFSEELQKYLKLFGGIRKAARAFPTPTGNDIPWPTVDDTLNKGELLAENTPATSLDVAFGQVILHAYKFSSKIVLVSMELLQDSFFDINTILRDLLGDRLGRITSDYMTTGTGTAQPQGCTIGITGAQGTTGSSTTVTYNQLLDLLHSVDPLYRVDGSWMFSDNTLKGIKKIVDSQGRPLWQPWSTAGFASNIAEDTILGYPYNINQSMADMGPGSPAVGNISILFGAFNRFIVRDVLEMTLLRLTERYAEYGQVGFLAFMRADSRWINTNACKYYQNSAT